MLTLFTILHIITCLVLMAVILLQSSKVQGIAGIVQGGAETFFGKNKGRSYEGKLAKATAAFMVLFIITSIALVVLGGK
ncbi:preprotein translocase subunit SecG [Oxobacter pfennigii]|uniref:Protein-export membrane protein SecG n=1 Tax=Oxobacter pfennigii TaxID=36849 RepID=A0A0P9AIF3_9CLOT|nr:preprotein translocase subunit SecG [Oxobacter pfennigii]KPU45244.1 preprotein translocase subunit SecG [Oxobacter pfennigii]